MTDLTGMTALVTGAARGQGAAEARRFVEAGAHVVMGDVIVDEGEARARELGPRAVFRRLDVTLAVDWQHAVRVPDGWPPLRILVNNAAVHWYRRLEDEDEAEVLRMWRVNQLGPFLGMQAVVAPMRAAGGGSIINVSSTAGLLGLPGLSAYGAAKWALRGLTKTAAVELGPDGIRVNSIHPGPIDTPMLHASPTFTGRQDAYAHLPLERCGEPDEVAALVLFLASPESAFITGAEIAIDGGMTAGGTRPRSLG
jgi:3alpha(or 20beta)-hydroxysteroid dehydrogenase